MNIAITRRKFSCYKSQRLESYSRNLCDMDSQDFTKAEPENMDTTENPKSPSVSKENSQESQLNADGDKTDDSDVIFVEPEPLPSPIAISSDEDEKPISSKKPVIPQKTRFECPSCRKVFSTEKEMNDHEIIHRGEKPYICRYCDRGYLRKSYLVVHEREHIGVKPFRCSVCSEGFSSERKLIAHSEKLKHRGPRKFKCCDCGRRFSFEYLLKVHINKTHIIKPHVCRVCKQAFRHKGTMITHERTHSGEKPFQCQTCFQEFSSSRQLTGHVCNVPVTDRKLLNIKKEELPEEARDD